MFHCVRGSLIASVALVSGVACTSFGGDGGDAGGITDAGGATTDAGDAVSISSFEDGCSLRTTNATVESAPAGAGRSGSACKICRKPGARYFNASLDDAPMRPPSSYSIEAWVRFDSGLVPTSTTLVVETNGEQPEIGGDIPLDGTWKKATLRYTATAAGKDPSVQLRLDIGETKAPGVSCVLLDDLVVRSL